MEGLVCLVFVMWDRREMSQTLRIHTEQLCPCSMTGKQWASCEPAYSTLSSSGSFCRALAPSSGGIIAFVSESCLLVQKQTSRMERISDLFSELCGKTFRYFSSVFFFFLVFCPLPSSCLAFSFWQALSDFCSDPNTFILNSTQFNTGTSSGTAEMLCRHFLEEPFVFCVCKISNWSSVCCCFADVSDVMDYYLTCSRRMSSPFQQVPCPRSNGNADSSPHMLSSPENICILWLIIANFVVFLNLKLLTQSQRALSNIHTHLSSLERNALPQFPKAEVSRIML